MQKEKVEIVIPFCGFYESYASSKVDDYIFNYWRDKNVKDVNKYEYHQLTEKQKEKWDKFAWSDKHDKLVAEYRKDFCVQYAKDFFELLKDESGVRLQFEEGDVVLESPRFYNFTTDRIFVKVGKAGLLELYKKLDKVKFAEKVKEKFTSYDGFASYYDNSIEGEDWVDVEKYDHNNWLTVVETFVDGDTEAGREALDNLICEIYI